VGYGSVGLVLYVLGTYRVNFMLCLSRAMRFNRVSAWLSEVSDGASIHTEIVGKQKRSGRLESSLFEATD
jgi:hypothetical protein